MNFGPGPVARLQVHQLPNHGHADKGEAHDNEDEQQRIAGNRSDYRGHPPDNVGEDRADIGQNAGQRTTISLLNHSFT